MLKRILYMLKPNDGLIKGIPGKISGQIFDTAYPHLNEFNKTVITLSSSSLILSFTAVQLGKLNIDKNLLTSSWIFFILVIISGVGLYYVNYIYIISCGIVKKNMDEKLYKDKKEFLLSQEASYYFNTRFLMYYLSLFQLLFFIVGIVLLTITAYKVI